MSQSPDKTFIHHWITNDLDPSFPPDESGLQTKLGKFLSVEEKNKAKVNRLKNNILELIQTKDLLHFILSCPVKPLADQFGHSEFCQFVSKLRLLTENLLDGDLEDLLLDIRGSLPKFCYGSEVYLPHGWKLRASGYLRKHNEDEIHHSPFVGQIPSWAIDAATRQASQCIVEEKMRLISISGQYAGKVTKSLKDAPVLRSKFDVILHISVSRIHSIEEVDKLIRDQVHEFHGQNNTSSLSRVEVLQLYNFLLILDGIGEHMLRDLHKLNIPLNCNHGCVVLATQLDVIHRSIIVDLDIRMDYHLLPLELFSRNAMMSILSFSNLVGMSIDLLEHCHGDVRAVVLLAKELQRVQSIDICKLALHELISPPNSLVKEGISDIMIRVLTFVWKRKGPITKLCIEHCTTFGKGEKIEKLSLISCWLRDCLVKTEMEGEVICCSLIDSFLLESSRNSLFMQEEVRDVLLNYIIPSKVLAWISRKVDDDNVTVNLKNSEVSELPESPNCPRLVFLGLQNNSNLMMIPPLFFKHMPSIVSINLSYTSIKTLPASVSALVSLRNLFMRGCELFTELPSEIGDLSELQVLDMEGTKVSYLPEEIAKLKKLQQLKLSFYSSGEGLGESKQRQRIPRNILPGLHLLKELWIGMLPGEDDEEWITEVKNIIDDLSKRSHNSQVATMTSLKLYFPETKLLKNLVVQGVQIHEYTVGRLGLRMISRIPDEVERKFKQQKQSLRYVNGECIPFEIMNVLSRTSAFFLDRHWTLKKLSELGAENMSMLKFCLLVECNELQTIMEGGDELYGSLEYLGIYYMKNLTSICRGAIGRSCLCRLKYLSLCTCTSLESILTTSLLGNLNCLEELVVEDCPKIKSLVIPDASLVHADSFLPSLKKMSLRELPELVSISNGLPIALKLERLVVFYCPKLGSLSEVSRKKLKVIKGEHEWWDSLPWQETDHLADIFVPLNREGNLMAQFSED